MMAAAQQPSVQLPVEGQLPSFGGAVDWLNSPPVTAEGLRGHVVLANFWTYSCINCLRALPYVEACAKKYRDQGPIVIRVHAPEFAFERNIDNVRAAVKRLGIDYPVAIDNSYAIWRGFNNEYWPAHYSQSSTGNLVCRLPVAARCTTPRWSSQRHIAAPTIDGGSFAIPIRSEPRQDNCIDGWHCSAWVWKKSWLLGIIIPARCLLIESLFAGDSGGDEVALPDWITRSAAGRWPCYRRNGVRFARCRCSQCRGPVPRAE
jgi:thiol-disulfide isomerase/thioredoxin